MTTTRKTALVAGILYLITEVTAITAMLSYGTVLTDPSSSSPPPSTTPVCSSGHSSRCCSPSPSSAPPSPCTRSSRPTAPVSRLVTWPAA